MINKIKQFLTKDLQWKILSVILAVVLWFVCINIVNPITSGRETVTLEIRGLDVLDADKKILLNKNNLNSMVVSVEVRGKTSDVSSLRGKINAYIDLSVFEVLNASQIGSELSTQINIEKTGNYEFDILNWSPKNANVIIDNLVTETKTVTLNDKGTTVAEGYAYTNPTIEPATVQITGASQQIEKIKVLSATVDLTDATETIHINSSVKAYDKDGEEIFTDIAIEPQSVSVTVPVSKVGKVSVMTPTYTGQPAEGYAVSGIDYDLKELEIMGTTEDVEEFIANKIKLAPVNIEGRSSTVRETQDLRTYLNDTRLNLVNNTPYECNITIRIEPLVTKTLTIPIEEVEVTGYTLGAQIMSTEIEVEIEGLSKDIDPITSLTASVDLSGLELGENAVPVTITPPKGVTVKQQTEIIDVLVTDITIEQEET